MIKKFLLRYWVWLLICLGIIIGISIPAYLHFAKGYVWADWIGFSAYSGPLEKENRSKTLWDILELLIVPAALAGTALWFSNQEKKEDRKAAEERAEVDREIATDRLQEQSLQAYLDKMTELLLEHDLRNSKAEDEVRMIARARTLATLRTLDGQRKGLLLNFLQESNLINNKNTLIVLTRADLTEAHLTVADLREADLREADLTIADLRVANLMGANLTGAYLKAAYLMGANLMEADLREADLRIAFLMGANLMEADLREADLTEAFLMEANLKGADLRRANLTGAIITQEQLYSTRSLEGAIMPDGSKHSNEQ